MNKHFKALLTFLLILSAGMGLAYYSRSDMTIRSPDHAAWLTCVLWAAVWGAWLHYF